MVSNARLDLPEPESPVITTSLSRGISTSTFLRLCSRAPRMTIDESDMCSPVLCFAASDSSARQRTPVRVVRASRFVQALFDAASARDPAPMRQLCRVKLSHGRTMRISCRNHPASVHYPSERHGEKRRRSVSAVRHVHDGYNTGIPNVRPARSRALHERTSHGFLRACSRRRRPDCSHAIRGEQPFRGEARYRRAFGQGRRGQVVRNRGARHRTEPPRTHGRHPRRDITGPPSPR